MSDRRLAAAFYLPAPAGDTEESLPDLLALAGAEDIAPAPVDEHSGLRYCRWAGLTGQGYLEQGPQQRLLVIFFQQSAYLETVPQGGGGPSGPVLDAFLRACRGLSPLVALLTAHPDQADVDVLRRIGGTVGEADAPRLEASRFGALYLSDRIASYQTGAWAGPGRAVVPVPGGWLATAPAPGTG
jgi:hypothetical protein